jgi:hypothetical protein
VIVGGVGFARTRLQVLFDRGVLRLSVVIPPLSVYDLKVLPVVILANQDPPVEAGALEACQVILAEGIVSNFTSLVELKVNNCVTVGDGSNGSIKWMKPTYFA